ncbi:15529_t:CDS:2, partial [Cetraspora pellucida]
PDYTIPGGITKYERTGEMNIKTRKVTFYTKIPVKIIRIKPPTINGKCLYASCFSYSDISGLRPPWPDPTVNNPWPAYTIFENGFEMALKWL